MDKQRLNNSLQTILLISAMLALVTILGYLIGGRTGLFWAFAAGAGMVFFGGNASPRFLLRMLRARELQPQQAPELYGILRELARRARLPRTPRLFYARQPFLNAFATGTRDDPIIGITEGLARNLDRRDLTSILAHEVSHIQHNDMRVMGFAAVIGEVARFFGFIGQVLFFFNIPLLLIGRSATSWFAIMLLLSAPMLTTYLQLALSRTREFEADLGAVRLTGDPAGMAIALQKLEAFQPRPRWVFSARMSPKNTLFSSHPPTEERIERLGEIAHAAYLKSKSPSPDWKRGQNRFEFL